MKPTHTRSDLTGHTSSNPAPIIETLTKQAVLGLNTPTESRNPTQPDPELLDGLPAGPQINDLLSRSQQTGAGYFLDAVALALHTTDSSALPAPQSFDELPPLPQASAPALSENRTRYLKQILACRSEDAFKLVIKLLQEHRCMLPPDLLIQILAQNPVKAIRQDLLNLAGEQALWLAQLTPELTQGADLSPPASLPPLKDFTDWLATTDADNLQQACADWRNHSAYWHTRYLNALPGDKNPGSWPFISSLWDQAAAGVRERLVPEIAGLLFIDPELSPEIYRWLCEHTTDRSAKVRALLSPLRALAAQRLLATADDQPAAEQTDKTADALAHANALDAAIKEELSACLHVTPQWTLEIQPPETLTDSLKALGVVNGGEHSSQPVNRLCQLIRLAGPQRLAEHLKMDITDLILKLACSRFGDELARTLLSISLMYRSKEALISWDTAFPVPHYGDLWALTSTLETFGWAGIEPLLTARSDHASEQHKKQASQNRNPEQNPGNNDRESPADCINIASGILGYCIDYQVSPGPALNQRLFREFMPEDRFKSTDGTDESRRREVCQQYDYFDVFLRWAAFLRISPDALMQNSVWQDLITEYPHQNELLAFKAACDFRASFA